MRRSFVSYVIIAAFIASGCGSQQKRLYADEEIALARPQNPSWLWSPSDKDVPPSPESILGKGVLKSSELAGFLTKTNPFIDIEFAEEFAAIYVEEAAAEGVNHDVAFSQMCLETGFLSFGGLVTPEMNNFCGLGSINPEAVGESFPSARIGIRAQIQHLKVYATDEPVIQENVDPRHSLVRPGSARTIYDLAGSWAEDKEYGKKLKDILDRLYDSAYRSGYAQANR